MFLSRLNPLSIVTPGISDDSSLKKEIEGHNLHCLRDQKISKQILL
jgi:hypothetical protein